MGLFDFAEALPIIGPVIQRQNDRAFATQQADKQQEFQQYMSGSAHQREVADLKAAGLNPILSAGGNGSSTPSGAGASPPAGFQPEISGLIEKGINFMFKDKELQLADKKINVDAALKALEGNKKISETENNKLKKILLQKGQPSAEVSGILYKALKALISGETWQKKMPMPGEGARQNPNFGSTVDPLGLP